MLASPAMIQFQIQNRFNMNFETKTFKDQIAVYRFEGR